MIDPNDKKTMELVDVASGRPALPLAELIQAAEAAAVTSIEDDDESAGPMDAAARQRKARAKRKSLGKKSVWLTDIERQAIQCALELLHDIPAPGLAATLDGALEAVAPGAVWPGKSAAVSSAKPSLREDLRTAQELRKEIERREGEWVLCLKERGEAWDAIAVLQKRLARANLPTDCRTHITDVE